MSLAGRTSALLAALAARPLHGVAQVEVILVGVHRSTNHEQRHLTTSAARELQDGK